MEAALQGKDVAVVAVGTRPTGGGVSAERARKSPPAARGDLNKNMSSYLVQRIEDTPNVEILRNTTVQQSVATDQLEAIEVVESSTVLGAPRAPSSCPCCSAHRSGAAHRLAPRGDREGQEGFVLTGSHIAQSKRWSHTRPPFLSRRHAGRVRGRRRALGLVSAWRRGGRGLDAVQFVHAVLAEIEPTVYTVSGPPGSGR